MTDGILVVGHPGSLCTAPVRLGRMVVAYRGQLFLAVCIFWGR